MLSVTEVSRRLRVNPDKVRSWIGKGELVGVNVAELPGCQTRWRVADAELQRFMRARQSAPAPIIRRPHQDKEEQVFFTMGNR